MQRNDNAKYKKKSLHFNTATFFQYKKTTFKVRKHVPKTNKMYNIIFAKLYC